MPLMGEGLLAVWTDVVPSAEDDFNLWYTNQHVPERVGVPGFLRGRRYAAPERVQHRYCAFYETETLAVLQSGAYLARLNDPTEWTQRVMPKFRNMIRGACKTLATSGAGIGGALATLRLDLSSAWDSVDAAALKRLTAELTSAPGIIGAHIAVRDRAIVGQPTKEAALRTTPDALFDGVLLLEGASRKELEARLADVERKLATAWPQAPVADVALYDLAFALTP